MKVKTADEVNGHGGEVTTNGLCGGPGYATPQEAMQKGPVEKVLYITCIAQKGDQQPQDVSSSDYLAVVDVDPNSDSFCKVVHRTHMPSAGDELHHFGWNSCSSCHSDCSKKRDKLVLLGLNSSNIHILSTEDPLRPVVHKTILGKDIARKFNVTAPHTAHCLGSGEVMVSTMGDEKGNGRGAHLLLDGETFEPKGLWQEEKNLPFGYDFWYHPRQNIMVSTEWGAPNHFRKGFDATHFSKGYYGHSVHFFNWTSRKHIKSIDLEEEGLVPLEVRFVHNPDEGVGYVACAMSSNIFRLFMNEETKEWTAEKVIQMDAVKLEGWTLPEAPALPTDILISLDDKYLYVSNWFHGDIRQYDISGYKRSGPLLVGRCWIGGLLTKQQLAQNKVQICNPISFVAQEQLVVKGTPIEGGPQMLQLSLDGKRLYVTTSLFSTWDAQFYSRMSECGSVCLQIDIDTENGGMTVNEEFLVDFGKEPNGPVLAHEVRYPGGDCTSDIWV
eukprot:GHVS01091371.1.p1 GENE.GHVS01091371.1~~GHVS01091371.1.p1  ORF type:complete len:499 (-),score=63.94 GHVS01091371.1:1603-3099(-)